jgi:O-acetyl-ADP-ribose deacetylase (regulator of RNase III)
MSMDERIHIEKGDITEVEVDAIVNAANSQLAGGGGVDGAIHRAAGPELLEACRKLGGCPTGSARMTEGFGLPAGHVIHAVGPVWSGGGKGEPQKLASCYRTSLKLAVEHGLKSVAFPLISTGVYGYPIDEACRIALQTIDGFLAENQTLTEVRIVCFNESTYHACRTIADS